MVAAGASSGPRTIGVTLSRVAAVTPAAATTLVFYRHGRARRGLSRCRGQAMGSGLVRGRVPVAARLPVVRRRCTGQ